MKRLFLILFFLLLTLGFFSTNSVYAQTGCGARGQQGCLQCVKFAAGFTRTCSEYGYVCSDGSRTLPGTLCGTTTTATPTPSCGQVICPPGGLCYTNNVCPPPNPITPTPISSTTPTPTPSPTPRLGDNTLSCDFDHNSRVDIFDFNFWKEKFITTPTGNADCTGDNITDIFDFNKWKETFLGANLTAQ